MNVKELRELLSNYPDDMPVSVVDDLNDCLDTDAAIDVAVNHPSVWIRRKSWHWINDPRVSQEGETVLVMY